MRKTYFSVLALALIVAMTGFLAGSAGAEVKSFTITSGPMGGDWYSIGGACGEMAKEAFPAPSSP